MRNRYPRLLALLRQVCRMRRPEFRMRLLIVKHAMQILHHSYRIRRHSIVVSAKPHQRTASILVNGIHQPDLLTALGDISLVDADLVGP